MSGDRSERATVLVVEDDRQLLELYERQLSGSYDVRTAHGGEAALASLSEEVDVVLLDRMMPDVSGDEVAAEIENEGYDCKVAMVTAVDPDFDILELGIDDYVVKPVGREDLLEVVEHLLTVAAYSEHRQRLGAKKLKRNVLRVEKDSRVLADSDRYDRLEDEIESLEARVDELSDDLSEDEQLRHR